MKKIVNIEFEDLFSNLLITLRCNGIHLDYVPYNLINMYESILLNDLDKKGKSGKYKIKNKNKDIFLLNNSEYYIDSKKDELILILKEMPIEQMIAKYQVCLPNNILRSIYSNRVVVETLRAYIDTLCLGNEKNHNEINTMVKKLKINE